MKNEKMKNEKMIKKVLEKMLNALNKSYLKGDKEDIIQDYMNLLESLIKKRSFVSM